MKKATILFMLMCLSALLTQAQDTIVHRPSDPQREQRQPVKDRLFTGGDLGLQFGDVTYIYVAPIIGYKLTDKFAMGGGPSYSYLNDKRNFYGSGSYTSSSYGGRVFSQYQVITSAMAYAEFSLINSDVIDDISFKLKRANITSLLIGGGYTEPIAGRSTFNLMILFDVIQDRYSYSK